MDKKALNIFLSASIPIAGRSDSEYLGTADIIAIRDSVIALVSVLLPEFHLIWGGHPSITPLIANVLRHSSKEVNNSVTVYQSDYFKNKMPEDNKDVEHIIVTKNLGDRDSSLSLMRKQMIDENEYAAAVFIGGMDGVEDEYELFVRSHPDAKVLPVASTGAAALKLYEKSGKEFDPRLKTDLAYASLFKDLILSSKERCR